MTMVPEFLRFVLVGAFNSVTTYLIFLLGLLIVPYLFAYALSYAIGLLVSFALNSHFVFRKRAVGVAEKVQFISVYVVQYISSSGLLWLLVDQIGIQPQYSVIIVMAVSAPLTYLALKTIFSK